MNLPNKISLSRIALIPIFLVIYLLKFKYAQVIGAGVFSLIMLTDALDGAIARKYNLVTNLGKFLDSIADKSLLAAGLFMILYSNINADIGLGKWIAVCATIIVLREFVISFVRQVAASRNLIIQADIYGKIKAVVQDISVPILLAAKDLKILFGINSDVIEYIGFAILLLATVLTIVSAINYFVKNGHVFRETEDNGQ